MLMGIKILSVEKDTDVIQKKFSIIIYLNWKYQYKPTSILFLNRWMDGWMDGWIENFPLLIIEKKARNIDQPKEISIPSTHIVV